MGVPGSSKRIMSIICLVAALFSLLLLMSCSSGSLDNLVNKPGRQEPVYVALKWLHQAQFTGNYVALEKGFYAKNGLNVTLAPFDFVTLPIDAVESGKAQFGIIGADELLIAKSQGKYPDLVAIAVVYKVNPVCLFAFKESKIAYPKSLLGKRVGIEKTADGRDINVGFLYYAMLKKNKLDRSDITEVPIGFDASDLEAGLTDVSSGYIINEPDLVIRRGYNVTTMLIADYGVRIYADVIVAKKSYLKDHADVARAFLFATFSGWEHALEDEEDAVSMVLKYASTSTREHELFMLKNSIPLVFTGSGLLGVMTLEDWQDGYSILVDSGLAAQGVDVASIFTNEYILGSKNDTRLVE